MKIDELIGRLEAFVCVTDGLDPFFVETIRKAAETIRLLWEVAKDTTNEKYKRQIDEWRGENDS